LTEFNLLTVWPHGEKIESHGTVININIYYNPKWQMNKFWRPKALNFVTGI